MPSYSTPNANFMLLTPSKLEQYLNQNLKRVCILSCFESIDNTNQFLLNQPRHTQPQICVTQQQTKGRGQYNRIWQSEPEKSLIFSIKYPLTGCDITGLSLVISLAILTALKQCFIKVDFHIKWPNDIYYKHKKLAGILIENQFYHHQNDVVIGVGINYRLPQGINSDNAIGLLDIVDNIPPQHQLLLIIINQILTDIIGFEQNGFAGFLSRWHTVDYLKGKVITLQNGNNYQVIGVDKQGVLLIQDSHQTTHKLYHSKDIKSIR